MLEDFTTRNYFVHIVIRLLSLHCAKKASRFASQPVPNFIITAFSYHCQLVGLSIGFGIPNNDFHCKSLLISWMSICKLEIQLELQGFSIQNMENKKIRINIEYSEVTWHAVPQLSYCLRKSSLTLCDLCLFTLPTKETFTSQHEILLGL